MVWGVAILKKHGQINRKSHLKKVAFESEPAGTRTQGPYIKSVLLYQLSYEFIPLRNWECKNNGFLHSSKMKFENCNQREIIVLWLR